MTVLMRKNRSRKPGEKLSFETVIAELEAAGTEQNRKIYRRHGASDPLFGVSFANINKLKKRIKLDHELGARLFDTANADAITLGLMVMDPEHVDAETLEDMLDGLTYYMLVDYLVGELVMYRPERHELMRRWTASDREYVKRAGYTILSNLARREDGAEDAVFRDYLTRIEAEIHTSPNRARQMMNIALLSIGLRPPLYAEALAAARRIGPVEIDHGETSCETTDSAAKLSDETYLAKARKSLKWL